MRVRAVVAGLLAGCAAAPIAAFAAPADACDAGCARTLELPGGRLNYQVSAAPGAPVVSALVALHGHSHDAAKTFEAGRLAARRAGVEAQTLVVAPLFQVSEDAAERCSTPGTPPARAGDLVWNCASWIDGRPAAGDGAIGSFAALDSLLLELTRRWPTLKTVTVAGFSAGAQMVQHAIGFAAPPPAGVRLRYVVADPGTWLYFDPVRPQAVDAAACPGFDRWKYGTGQLPAGLGTSAAEARERYAAAEIHYLEGELDTGEGRGTAYRVLDRSCAALAQGPYRLQRGLAYAEYDRSTLAPAKARRVTVVPGCAHDVACVFPSDAARTALFGPP